MQPPLDGSPKRPSTPFYLRPLSLCPSARTRGVPALLLRPLMRRGRKRTSYVDQNHGKAHPEGGRHPALFPRPLATPPMATPHRQNGTGIRNANRLQHIRSHANHRCSRRGSAKCYPCVPQQSVRLRHAETPPPVHFLPNVPGVLDQPRASQAVMVEGPSC